MAKSKKETEVVVGGGSAKKLDSAKARPAPRASIKNRNLALSMGSRPSVQAALKIKNVNLFFFYNIRLILRKENIKFFKISIFINSFVNQRIFENKDWLIFNKF